MLSEAHGRLKKLLGEATQPTTEPTQTKSPDPPEKEKKERKKRRVSKPNGINEMSKKVLAILKVDGEPLRVAELANMIFGEEHTEEQRRKVHNSLRLPKILGLLHSPKRGLYEFIKDFEPEQGPEGSEGSDKS